jgi:hypothetical protein
VKKQKITGTIISKEYQEKSNNYKLKITATNRKNFFFYSQQKDQGKTKELKEGQKYTFSLYNSLKYWFLEK